MNKRKTTIVILSIIAMSILAGCVGTSPSSNTPSTSNPVTAKSADWCKVGSKFTSTTSAGAASSEVIGITDFKGHTVCQTEVKTGEYTMTSYTSQDGTYNYYVMKDGTGKVTYEGEQSAPK